MLFSSFWVTFGISLAKCSSLLLTLIYDQVTWVDVVLESLHGNSVSSSLSQGYAPLFSDFDSFYTRRLKLRIEDCFSRPITAVAARTAVILNRTPTNFFADFTFTGETTQALNVSSYNYLGFAQSRGPCADQAEEIVRKLGVTTSGGRNDVGTSDLHIQAERLVAKFVGTEDSMIVSMGFATNSTTLPALMCKGCLIISDELNHSSIRFGARLSGAMVRMYKHNDMEDLDNLLRECISQGQPRTHRPWKKILLIVEGLYSMEGTMVDLPRILELKQTYKVSLVWILLRRLSLIIAYSLSSIFTSTRLTQSVLSDPVDEEYATTSALTLKVSISWWELSRNVSLDSRFCQSTLSDLSLLLQLSVPLVDTLLDLTNSSLPFDFTLTPKTTPKLCLLQSFPKSAFQWDQSWVSKLPRSSLLSPPSPPTSWMVGKDKIDFDDWRSTADTWAEDCEN